MGNVSALFWLCRGGCCCCGSGGCEGLSGVLVSPQVSTWNSGHIFRKFLLVFSLKLVEITRKREL